jgi:hypothetical protein
MEGEKVELKFYNYADDIITSIDIKFNDSYKRKGNYVHKMIEDQISYVLKTEKLGISKIEINRY